MTIDEVARASDRPLRHRLDGRHFAALAAGAGDDQTISRLLAAESSWRKVQLRTVLDAVADLPEAAGPLPPVRAAWDLLAAAQHQDAAAVGRLMLHPQVGTWAGYLLRRLRGTAPASSGPFWVDVGYLHALAVAAAVRAGLTFSMRVPVCNGFVAIPTLGGARVPTRQPCDQVEVTGAAGTATISTGETTVTFHADGRGTEGWVPVPTVRAEADGHVLEVTLDFVDPYRNLRAPTPPHLDISQQVRRWQELLDQAWRLLVEVCPDRAVPIARGLSTVVPQPPAERFRTMSASAGDAFGSIIVSEPEDAPELAVTLVHEFQHIKLGGLLHLTPLLTAEPAHRLYAPWRDDPRPLGGLLQGVYAFVGITEFWRAYRLRSEGATAALAHFEFARWRRQVWATLRRIRELPELTEVGRCLLAGLSETAAGWQDDPVPTAVRKAAEGSAADHEIRWRIHHRRPAADVVAAFVEAWRTGQAAPALGDPEPAVLADPSARRLDSRAVLHLWQLTDPAGFARLAADPAAVDERVSGATEADVALVGGDPKRAHVGYLAALAMDPGSPAAWAGLSATSAVPVAGPAVAALRSRPELVRLVYREIRAVADADPLDVAAWVGPGPTDDPGPPGR
ncbi:HEXXH motif domain-containing protein [Micromonospora ureilytica]|uniref:HEXXH motif domain-containing protein n=1 Tax=Micromonospora ureilytica TaxID=709868 RepID=UPI0033D9B508